MNAPTNLELVSAVLATAGFRLLHTQLGPMDSGLADFTDGSRHLRVIKDRSQWMLDGAKKDLERAGLWRAFDDTEEFRDALLAYISRPTA
jgi:hypothetical protein